MAIFTKTPLNVCFRAGIIGALVMTVGMAFSRSLQPSPLNMELALGGLFTTGIDPLTWVIGFLGHLLIGGVVGLAYYLGFRAIRRSGVRIGIAFGVLHWIITGLLMGIVPAIFSVLPELMPEPYFFALNFGPITVASNLVMHLIFGAIVGERYGALVRELALPRIKSVEPIVPGKAA